MLFTFKEVLTFNEIMIFYQEIKWGRLSSVNSKNGNWNPIPPSTREVASYDVINRARSSV